MSRAFLSTCSSVLTSRMFLCAWFSAHSSHTFPVLVHPTLQDLDAESAAAKRRPLVALSRDAFADYFRIVSALGNPSFRYSQIIAFLE
jgi:hypothetical protein